MGKKCIPGVLCIENVTLAFLFITMCTMVYIYYNMNKPYYKVDNHSPPNVVVVTTPPLMSISARSDPMNDPYAPPLRENGYYNPRDSSDVRGMPSMGIPVHMKTRGLNADYSQIGILTRNSGMDNMILPLMGRRNMAGRDKWQYYTISNSGNINAKLPVSVNGKNCSAEYGCDEINNGDNIYVEGYKDIFTATVYENGTFSYIPYI